MKASGDVASEEVEGEVEGNNGHKHGHVSFALACYSCGADSLSPDTYAAHKES